MLQAYWDIGRMLEYPIFQTLSGKLTWSHVAEYALGGLSNQLFAANYVYTSAAAWPLYNPSYRARPEGTYYIPEKEQLIAEVKALLEKEEDNQVYLEKGIK